MGALHHRHCLCDRVFFHAQTKNNTIHLTEFESGASKTEETLFEDIDNSCNLTTASTTEVKIKMHPKEVFLIDAETAVTRFASNLLLMFLETVNKTNTVKTHTA